MKIRLILMMFAVLAVSACTSDGDQSADMMADDAMMNDPMRDSGVTSVGLSEGTQENLVATVGDRVFFGYDEHNLTDQARQIVGMQAEWLQQYPNVNVVVEGHCDERGTREYNLALGDRRATAVRNYLIASGVSPERVRTISYGKERPAVPGSYPEAWAQNRRSVLVVE